MKLFQKSKGANIQKMSIAHLILSRDDVLTDVDVFDMVKSCDIDALRKYAKTHVLHPIWRNDQNPFHALFLGYLNLSVKAQCEFDKDDAMLECCELLMEYGYQPDNHTLFKVTDDKPRVTVLDLAIRAQRWRCVAWMVQKSRKKSLVNSYDTSAPWVRVCCDEKSICACDSCAYSLMSTMENNHLYCFEHNIADTAQSNVSTFSQYETDMNYLHLAVQRARPHFLKTLLESGVPLDKKNRAGHTPLSLVFTLFTESQEELFKECARILLAHGAKLENVNRMDIPPWALSMAREMGISIPSEVSISESTTTTTVPCETTPTHEQAALDAVEINKVPEVSATVSMPGPDKTLHARGKAELLRHWFATLDGAIHNAAFVHHHDIVAQRIKGEGLRKHIAESYKDVGYHATSGSSDDGCIEIRFF